ncbi:MAG TPA: YeeE/YedE family protein [Verrucomicrobiae bacterium]|jgi:uncharacterized membrane protein YedE/YeeE|nr:YeeE/YedE family protein [Verrucomicrobiae bacterium]
MENFTPISAVIGGILIGLAATLLLAANGRIAGISGIAGGLLQRYAGARGWRLMFLAGLVLAPAIYRFAGGMVPEIQATSSIPLLIAGGLLVGYGTSLGRGCTSGHGVCGLARFSPRSLAATLTFLAMGIITVFVMRHILAG